MRPWRGGGRAGRRRSGRPSGCRARSATRSSAAATRRRPRGPVPAVSLLSSSRLVRAACLAASTSQCRSTAQVARQAASRSPGRPRREIFAWPRKLPDSLRAGDIPACLTTDDDDSFFRRSPVSARIAASVTGDRPGSGRSGRRRRRAPEQRDHVRLGLGAAGPGILQVRQRAAGPASPRGASALPPGCHPAPKQLTAGSPAACRPSSGSTAATAAANAS